MKKYFYLAIAALALTSCEPETITETEIVYREDTSITSGLRSQITQLQGQINTLNGQINQLNTGNSQLQTQIQLNEDAINDLEDENEDLLKDLEDAADDLQESLNDYNALQASSSDEISDLEDEVDSLEDAIDDLEDKIDELESLVANGDSDIEDYLEEISELEDNIALLQSEIEGLEDDLDVIDPDGHRFDGWYTLSNPEGISSYKYGDELQYSTSFSKEDIEKYYSFAVYIGKGKVITVLQSSYSQFFDYSSFRWSRERDFVKVIDIESNEFEYKIFSTGEYIEPSTVSEKRDDLHTNQTEIDKKEKLRDDFEDIPYIDENGGKWKLGDLSGLTIYDSSFEYEFDYVVFDDNSAEILMKDGTCLQLVEAYEDFDFSNRSNSGYSYNTYYYLNNADDIDDSNVENYSDVYIYFDYEGTYDDPKPQFNLYYSNKGRVSYLLDKETNLVICD